MKVVAVVPIKLTNRRFPHKNTRHFTNGDPLCTYILKTLLEVKNIDEIYVYCSDKGIADFLPKKVIFKQREKHLDQDDTKMNEVLSCFAQEVPADIYVMTHVTAPFISEKSISGGVEKVLSGEYDSAFAVKKIQDFLWENGKPLNYDLRHIPRTQDLPVIYQETSGFYIYHSDVIKEGRRIGNKPYIVEVSEVESIDIDEKEDFLIADAIFNHITKQSTVSKPISEEVNPQNNIAVLDCTLRDGGYCNNWMFGKQNIKKIIQGLTAAKIDIIECGFITESETYIEGSTRFNTLLQIEGFIPKVGTEGFFVAMINYGEYDIQHLPFCKSDFLMGIRVAFHKKDLLPALKMCYEIQEKGYKVFIQPMISLNYSEEEFFDLVCRCNAINPYAFYIVDSFGIMKKDEMKKFFIIADANLRKEIIIGFHSHNNMQLSFSNAQDFLSVHTNRNLIIDSSVFGMGRGAGNLNTELLIQYLNNTIGKDYQLKPLLNIIDEVLEGFYDKNRWGYSLANYLSAIHNIHPNYANYLTEKNTLTVENIDELFSLIQPEKKNSFDKEYIDELYFSYMTQNTINQDHLADLKENLKNKRVLIIGPGKSAEKEWKKIKKFALLEDVVSISIGYDYPRFDVDYIFISNRRRFREITDIKTKKIISTSNIPVQEVYLQVDYEKLLNDVNAVRDNAVLMLIQFLLDMEIKRIVLAGIDGYSHDREKNYILQELEMVAKNETLDAINAGMETMLHRYNKIIDIDFLTESKYRF